MTTEPVTYTNYLKIDELLQLQRPRSPGPEHDEMLFIIIHQVYELWFKQILHELDFLCDRMNYNDRSRILHTLRRVLTILKTLVGQLDILETMTPLEFMSFRDRLESASGFQSHQFRELEFLLGHKRRTVLIHYPLDTPARAKLEERYKRPTLWDIFLRFLADAGYAVPAASLKRDVTQPVTPSPETQAVLISLYQQDDPLIRVCERLVDLDEGIQEWRYRHVKMVERTIGTKPGTGGSPGAKYLASTLSKPIFPDLWAIRAAL